MTAQPAGLIWHHMLGRRQTGDRRGVRACPQLSAARVKSPLADDEDSIKIAEPDRDSYPQAGALRTAVVVR